LQKITPPKTLDIIWVSQGFLEEDIVWNRCGYFDLKIRASIIAFNIADCTMTNASFFESLFLRGWAPRYVIGGGCEICRCPDAISKILKA
jgi:hypothetical protein